jgi:PEP-CTERM putative exosortase interaction domain
MKFRTLAVLALSVCAVSGVSRATPIGIPDPNFGTFWDTFSGIAFEDATGTGTNPFMNVTLSAANGGGIITGSGDRYYSGVGPNTAAVDFSINGTALIALDSITVYLKYTNPAEMTGVWADYFTVTLNGVSTTQVELGGTGEFVSDQEMGVVRLTWTGLNIGAGETFEISITRPASGLGEPGHVSIDGIQVVPEPATLGLVSLGLGFLAMRRRR